MMNPCIEDARCCDGTCSGGRPKDCDDNNECTEDSCHPRFGCVHLEKTKSCDDRNNCTTDDSCKNGKCTGKPLCPYPAASDIPTIGGQWSTSGKVVIFATQTHLVLQWIAEPGWTASCLKLYVSLNRPTDLVPGQMPYKFCDRKDLKYVELRVPLSAIRVTCNSKVYVALHLDTRADSTALCGRNKMGNLDSCKGEQTSWLFGPERVDDKAWGRWFLQPPLCCCFDSSRYLADTRFIRFTFGENQPRREKNDKRNLMD